MNGAPDPLAKVPAMPDIDNDEIAPLALHLSRLLAGQATQQTAPLIAASTLLLLRERDLGHVCVYLDQWVGISLPGHAPFPGVKAWRAALLASGVCGPGHDSAPTPLVLDDADGLYLLRHHRTEGAIGRWLHERLRQPSRCTPEQLAAALQQEGLLPARPAEVDWQLAAVCAAARSSFAVLTGGPGTGKTTTVANVLRVLLRMQPGLQVALCAPTGKAASRLQEALVQRGGAALTALLGRTTATTLHRLLGYLPLQDRFRLGSERQLPHDVVVVDEASMVDPAVLLVLLQALSANARLLLIGDRDQLASVAAGQVLGDLCQAAAPELGATPAFAAFVQAATGMTLPRRSGTSRLGSAVVSLRQNYRFAQQPGIGAFAQALAQRQPDQALAALRHGHADLALEPDAGTALATLEPALEATMTASDASAALAALARFRVLCATHHGPGGTGDWNQRIETLLLQRGLRSNEVWYRGRPVLVLANDHRQRLYNGDLGICWPDEQGRPQLWFPTTTGVRAVSPLRLPPHTTAFAMTVHKAQGSEFDHVVLSMPAHDGPLWHASLLYTGITRARQRAVLVADPALLSTGLRRWPVRRTGLGRRVDGELDDPDDPDGAHSRECGTG